MDTSVLVLIVGVFLAFTQPPMFIFIRKHVEKTWVAYLLHAVATIALCFALYGIGDVVLRSH